ncbi:uncharacterized protein LOC111264118 isoform X2 [Varroa jacobsoni]|uniref:uncharacterized protein LOC111264118 isoform X2 n=1 Tax=Varroa jacobsoni TaxID=62625 RepID=UPI000BF9EF40|nr:uncharacterized protein LOC111264118 isoform X2 [Varroa jacobsoni]
MVLSLIIMEYLHPLYSTMRNFPIDHSSVEDEVADRPLCRCIPCGVIMVSSNASYAHFNSSSHIEKVSSLNSHVAECISRWPTRRSRFAYSVGPRTPEEAILADKIMRPMLVCGEQEKFRDFAKINGLLPADPRQPLYTAIQ